MKSLPVVVALKHQMADPRKDREAGETLLWMSVVETAVQDLRLLTALAERRQSRGQPHDRHIDYKYTTLLHEVSTKWFKEVCDMASIAHSRVIELMKAEAKAAGINDLTYVRTIDDHGKTH